MEKEIKTSLWIEDAVRVRAYYLNDFDGLIDKWKLSFYEVWRWQMTWDFAYEIKVHEVHSGDVCLDLLVKPAYVDQCLGMLEDLGYRNIHTDYSEQVGIIPLYDMENADNVFTVIAE